MLSIGVCVHRGRRDTEIERVATTARISHLVRDIYDKPAAFDISFMNDPIKPTPLGMRLYQLAFGLL